MCAPPLSDPAFFLVETPASPPTAECPPCPTTVPRPQPSWAARWWRTRAALARARRNSPTSSPHSVLRPTPSPFGWISLTREGASERVGAWAHYPRPWPVRPPPAPEGPVKLWPAPQTWPDMADANGEGGDPFALLRTMHEAGSAARTGGSLLHRQPHGEDDEWLAVSRS